jgi:hypothetical protein
MADIASIIMAGISEKKSVAGMAQNQRNLDRQRMDRIMKDTNLQIERSREMQKKAKAEKEVGNVKMLTGAAIASGQVDSIPGGLQGLGLETAAGRGAAGAAMAGLPGVKETQRVYDFNKKTEAMELEAAELGLDAKRREAEEAKSELRTKDLRASVLGSLASTVRTGGDIAGSLQELEARINADSGLNADEKQRMIGRLQMEALNLQSLNQKIGDRASAAQVANLIHGFDYNDKTFQSLAEMDAEEAAAFREYALNDPTIDTEQERAMLAQALDSAFGARVNREFKERELKVAEGKAGKAQRAAIDKARAAAQLKRDENNGLIFGQRDFAHTVGVAVESYLSTGGNFGGTRGIQDFETMMQQQRDLKVQEMRKNGASEALITVYIEAQDTSLEDFISNDRGIKMMDKLLVPGAASELIAMAQITTPVFTFEGETYEGGFDAWPENVQSAFQAKAISDVLSAAQMGGQMALGVRGGQALQNGPMLSMSPYNFAGAGTAIAMQQFTGQVGQRPASAANANARALAARFGVTGTEVADKQVAPVVEGGGDVAPQGDEGKVATGRAKDLFSISGAVSSTAAAQKVKGGIEGARELVGQAFEAVSDLYDMAERGTQNIVHRERGATQHDIDKAYELKAIYDAGGLSDEEFVRQLQDLAPTFIEPTMTAEEKARPFDPVRIFNLDSPQDTAVTRNKSRLLELRAATDKPAADRGRKLTTRERLDEAKLDRLRTMRANRAAWEARNGPGKKAVEEEWAKRRPGESKPEHAARLAMRGRAIETTEGR